MNLKNESGAVVTTGVSGTKNPTTLKEWVYKMADQIKNALPANVTPERIMRIAVTALSKNPVLATSTRNSFLGALLTASQLGLECNTPLGQAYLIPYRDNKKGIVETQFQLGYQGLIDLCWRTGKYKTIQARVVYKGDTFEYEYGLNEKLLHKPAGKSDEPTHVYAYYQLNNDAKAFEVMSWEDILRFAKKYSQSVRTGKTSPWSTDPESMAKKTVLKKVLKYAPKTVEVAEAISSDTNIIRSTGAVAEDGGEVIKDIDFSVVEEDTAEENIGKDAPEPEITMDRATPSDDKKANTDIGNIF